MWFLGGAIFRSRLFWVALAAFFIGAYGYHLGNRHGPNARAYAAVVKQLAATNKKLSALEKEDTEIAAAEKAKSAAADAAFSREAPVLKKLIIDEKIAHALNALIEE